MLVIYCRLCRHCRNLAEGGCLLSRFHFTRCRYFLDHDACQNLPWQGLNNYISVICSRSWVTHFGRLHSWQDQHISIYHHISSYWCRVANLCSSCGFAAKISPTRMYNFASYLGYHLGFFVHWLPWQPHCLSES